jgi:hypothetical protein
MIVLRWFAAAAQLWRHNPKIECVAVMLQYNYVSVVFTLACAGCGLDYYCRFSITFLVVKPLLNAFKLTSLDFGCEQVSTMISLEDCKDIEWQQHGMIQPHREVITDIEHLLDPSLSWIYLLHHNQHSRFCHHLLHLNLRLQCNAVRLYVPPPLPSSLTPYPSAPGAASPALALWTPQRRQLLRLSGLTLSLLRLLMRSPDRRGVHPHELHRALKRVNSTATAAKVFAVSTQPRYRRSWAAAHAKAFMRHVFMKIFKTKQMQEAAEAAVMPRPVADIMGAGLD